MKYLLSLLAVVVISSAFTFTSNPEPQGEIKVKWMSWEEAVQANKKNPKKIFIDVYTDWCGWCKKMDKTTLSNPKIVKELNANFYSVKFDAEQKESINFDGNEFKFVNQGRKGVHELAYSLLDGRMGYPAFVFLDETFSRIMISPGFKEPEALAKELEFTKTEAYKTTSWENYTGKTE